MSKYTRINVAIPVNNKWSLEDIDNRADQLGMSRADFVLKAIDFLVNIDILTYKKMDLLAMASNFEKIPMHIYLQNKLIKDFALSQAAREIGREDLIVNEFIITNDKDGLRMLTGMELQKELTKQYINILKSDRE